MARDVRVAFKMSEEKKQELEYYADSYGVTMSALCALIVGQWLHQQKNVVNPMLQEIADAVKGQMSNLDIEGIKREIENMAKEQDRS